MNFDTAKYLKNIPLLDNLSDDERQKLADGLREQVFNKGDLLMKHGEVGREFFLVIRGSAKVYTPSVALVATLESGDYCGEQALLNDAVRGATVEATADNTICLVCDQRTFKSVLGDKRFAKRDAKRRAVLTAVPRDTIKEDPQEEAAKAKDKDIEDWLLRAVDGNLLFDRLDPEQRAVVIKEMYREEIQKGKNIITQGDRKAETFYVVEQGTFDIIVDDRKVACFGPGKCFGELALMYDAPRAATVKATTACAVWTVRRRAFRKAVQQLYKQQATRNMEFLKQVKSFETLLKGELSLIDEALEERSYKKGTVVINQGDEGDRFYIIKKGTATFIKRGDDDQVKDTGDLKVGTYFGELALLKNEPRAASIIAKKDLTCLELSRDDFNLLLGNLDEIMKERADGAYKAPELRKRPSLMIEGKNVTTPMTSLKHVGVLGKGAFGYVTLVLDPSTNQSYALKAIKKKQVIDLGQQAHIINEKKVMQMMNNFFLVNLRATYKDPRRVYFLLDACLGGELFTILRRRRYFDEPTSRFYAACVIEGFDYMHAKNIIYRDLKPENLVLDANGYLKITDFGFAKVVPERTFTLCGTPDYLAPEIVTGQGHGKGVDWWTLGILIYEMLASFPPFFDDEPIETYRKIIKGRIKFPRYFSGESKDLIKNLLRSKATRRLGVITGGADKIRNHPWYSGFDWDALRAGKLAPPIRPKVKDPSDVSNFRQNVKEDDSDAPAIPKEQDFDDDF